MADIKEQPDEEAKIPCWEEKCPFTFVKYICTKEDISRLIELDDVVTFDHALHHCASLNTPEFASWLIAEILIERELLEKEVDNGVVRQHSKDFPYNFIMAYLQKLI